MLQKFLKHRLVVTLCGISMLFVLGGFFWSYFFLWTSGAGPFILHFSDMNGITNNGGLGAIVSAGVLGFLVVLINFFIAMEFEKRDKFLGKFLAAATLLFAILLFIGFAAIISVN